MHCHCQVFVLSKTSANVEWNAFEHNISVESNDFEHNNGMDPNAGSKECYLLGQNTTCKFAWSIPLSS